MTSEGTRRRARWMVLSVCCVLFGSFASAAHAATATFLFTGGEQTFTVPAGISSVHIVAIGGIGGDGGAGGGGAGGVGAQVSGDLSVTPGQALFIEVAGNGQSATSGGAGGFNGGASGGGGGGGASDIRTVPRSAGLSPDRRLIVAAGGGGGAGAGSSGGGGAGGAAGIAGADDPGGGGNGGGGPGTSSAGGGGGIGGSGDGSGGLLGFGGAGATAGPEGGGGAGGYYGGGGGGSGINFGGGGGGGGSSRVPVGGSSVLSVQQPRIQITYTPAAPPPVADKVPPTISTLGFGSSTFRAAGKGASIAKAPVGTRVRYRVSEAGTAKFTVERAAKGRKKGRKCVAPTKKNRKAKRCTRYVKLKGSFSRTSTPGLNSFRFTGRLRGKKLRPGRYRLVMVATDAAKNKSKPKRAKFRIALH